MDIMGTKSILYTVNICLVLEEKRNYFRFVPMDFQYTAKTHNT